MKTHKHIFTALVALCLLSQGVFGQTIIFDDKYWGGQGTTDLVGASSLFELEKVRVTYAEDLPIVTDDDYLEIQIMGNYFDNMIAGTTNNTSGGDLFIDTVGGLSWNAPYAPTLQDYMGNGKTQWEYGVVMGQYKTVPGDALVANQVEKGTLVKINNGDANISRSQADTASYRPNQEWQIGDAAEAWNHGLTDPVTWWVDNDSLTIKISQFSQLFTLNPNGHTDFAFHWTMSCANDVVEFAVRLHDGDITELPEPSTIGLLGIAGLAGFLMIRRRLRRK